MAPKRPIADAPADVQVSTPTLIAEGFMRYERFDVALPQPGEPPLCQTRDLLRAAHVAAVIPIDPARDAIVLIRQFRLSAHLAVGRGEMIEIVAGRVDANETPAEAAARECVEEIGIGPRRLAELYTVLTTPGITDERVTFFVANVDSAAVPLRGGLVEESESIEPFVVSIDDALAALNGGKIANALLVSALQWLALNRVRLRDLLSEAA